MLYEGDGRGANGSTGALSLAINLERYARFIVCLNWLSGTNTNRTSARYDADDTRVIRLSCRTRWVPLGLIRVIVSFWRVRQS